MLYQKIQLENLEKIQTQVLELHTAVVAELGFNEGERHLDIHSINNAIPELIISMDALNYKIKEAYLITFRQIGHKIIKEFIEPETTTRIVIPIKNFKSCDLNYFHVQSRQRLYGYTHKDELWNLCRKIDSQQFDTVSLENPLCYKINVPHNMFIKEYSKIPVIFLIVVLDKEFVLGESNGSKSTN
jgi:hypothetical protein